MLMSKKTLGFFIDMERVTALKPRPLKTERKATEEFTNIAKNKTILNNIMARLMWKAAAEGGKINPHLAWS